MTTMRKRRQGFTPDEEIARRIAAHDAMFSEPGDDRAFLAEHGFEKAANILIRDGLYWEEFVDGWKDNSVGVYVHVLDGRVVRVGTAKHLFKRHRAWQQDVQNRLKEPDGKSPTVPWEAELWVRFFEGRQGELWVRPTQPMQTAVGEALSHEVVFVEERILLRRYTAPGMDWPLMNRSAR